MSTTTKFSLRLVIVFAAATSVGLSMAFVSIARLFLTLCGLVVMLRTLAQQKGSDRTDVQSTSLATTMWSTKLSLVALAAFAASMLWTVGAWDDVFMTFAKYGKLLSIPLLIAMIRTRSEALLALAFFSTTQILLVLASWALFAGLPVPWANSAMAQTEHAVFSTYLDQGIISAVFAFVCWHLRHLVPGRYGRHLAVAVGLIALANVFFVLSGRSGHAVAVVLLSLSIMFELPKRSRALVVVIPFVLSAVLFFSSSKVNLRVTQVFNDVTAYSSNTTAVTSSGIRLNLWQRAIESMSQNPLKGSGVGSWSHEYNRIEVQHNAAYKAAHQSNPHQEYLMWAMQLGIPGLLLFCALLLALLWDATKLPASHARATQSVVIGLAVACLFNCSLYDALIGDFFCITLGLMFALGYQMRMRPLAQQKSSRPQQVAKPLSDLTA